MRKLLVFVVIAHLALANGQDDVDDIYKKYKFVFNTGDSGAHTREEESDGSGHVKGMYSYLDPNGILRTVRYNSAPGAGYHAYGDGIPQIGSVLLKTKEQDISLDGLKDSKIIDAELAKKIHDSEIVSKMQDAELINKNYTSDEDSNVIRIAVSNSTNVIDEEYVQRNGSSQENSVLARDKITKEATTGSSSTSMIVNHNKMVPFIFPYSPYRLPMNFGPFLYAVPSAFTYNFAAPHYQIVL